MTAMSASVVGFGIVGVGLIADVHARALAAVEGARLVGVAGRAADKTAAFAARHQVPFHTTKLSELLARPDVDVLCVTTPSGAHLEPALEAIRAGKHVMVEKPLEITEERVDRMLAEADRVGVQVGAIFQARFGPGAQTLKRAVEGGRFGPIAFGSARIKWYRAPEYYRDSWHGTRALDGGGALMNQGIHAVDLLQWCLGLPRTVFAWSGRRFHTGIQSEDTVAATLRFASGALGSIEASTAHFPGWARRIEIGGGDGSAALEDDRIVQWDFRVAQPEDEAIRGRPADARLAGGAGSPAIGAEGHIRQYQEFASALRAGRAPALTGREGRKAVALVSAVYASAEAGRPIDLSMQTEAHR